MAALASSAVSLFPGDIASSEWPSGGKGNRSRYTRNCKVVFTGQGTVANPIPAAAFGFSRLLTCGAVIDVANTKVITAVVDPTKNIILIGGGSGNVAQDISSTEAYIMVEGVV
jgi:hypothetical protein